MEEGEGGEGEEGEGGKGEGGEGGEGHKEEKRSVLRKFFISPLFLTSPAFPSSPFSFRSILPLEREEGGGKVVARYRPGDGERESWEWRKKHRYGEEITLLHLVRPRLRLHLLHLLLHLHRLHLFT